MPGAWYSNTSLNVGRQYTAGCGDAMLALSFGGLSGSVSGVTERASAGVWTTLGATLSTPRCALGGVGDATLALAFGGDSTNGGAKSAVTEKFNGTVWSTSGNMTTPRMNLSGAGSQSSMVAFGGRSDDGNNGVTEKFNGSVWSTSHSMDTSRQGLAGCGTRDAALSFGGLLITSNIAAPNTETYNGASWQASANMGTARGFLAGGGTRSAALSFGGTGTSWSGQLRNTEDFNGSTWSASGDLNTGRYGLGGATSLPTYALSFGGSTGSTCEMYQAYSAPSITTTTAVSSINTTSATSGGSGISNGSPTISDKGICWGTSSGPLYNGASVAHASPQTGSTSFTVSTTNNLTPGAYYYLRAWVQNTYAVAYGNELYFRTLLAPTAPTTAAATAISAVSATSGGSVVTDGNPSISDKGICWGTSSGPVYNGSHSHPATVTGASSFTCATGTLVPGTHYYLRAWVWNSLGPVYGNEVQFDAGIPSVSTGTPSAVTAVSASVVGTITTNGDTVGERGVCYVLGSGTPTTSNTKAIGSGNPYTSTLTLSPGATYQAKTYIIDSGGSTRYGGQISITAGVPSATTSSVSSITAITAASGVSVTPNGDTIGARGVCWGTSPSPDTSGVHSEAFSGDNVGVSMGAIIPLIPNTTYYVRAYVVGSNSVPYYGSQLSFLTLSNAHTMSLLDVGKL